MENQSNGRMTIGRSLLDDPDAWAIVRDWASERIDFPTFDRNMQSFGDRYVSSDWNPICNRVFDLSEDGDITAATAYIEDLMKARGLLSPPTPVITKGKRKAESGEQPPRNRKRTRRLVNAFLDVEAQADDEEDDEESTGEREDDDDFIVAPSAMMSRDAAPQMRIYPISERAGPSTYLTAIDSIAKRFLPPAIESLDDDEYNRQLDYYAGRDALGEGDELEEESDTRQVLQPAELYDSIHDWVLGTQDYYTLVESIDYQYDFNPKIQYWEDFLSKLALFEDQVERERYFKSISLTDHLRQLANYQPSSMTSTTIGDHATVQDLAALRPAETPKEGVWMVKVVPRSSAEYIVAAWKNLGLDAKVYKLLPGRVTVGAAYPNIFLHTVPVSHRSCIRSWSLIPVEDRIPTHLFGRPTPLLPAWYTISKRGMYKGDIAYALDFDSDTMEFKVLVAPRRLKPKKPLVEYELLGQSTRSRRLFSPEEHCGQPLTSLYGLPRYRHKEQVFISGLLLMRVNIGQIAPLSSPLPQQIALHVSSMVNPSFMKATYKKYNYIFWKTGDRVTISDPTHLGMRANIVSIERESQTVVVRLCEGPEHPVTLSSLSRLYHVGDTVRVIEDPFSDHQCAYHEFIGRYGFVSHIDCETGEATITAGNDEFQVSQHLLESHSPDQRVWAPIGVLKPSVMENPAERVEVGDMVEVRCGRHTGSSGFVICVERSAGTLNFVSPHNVDYKVPIDAVTFTLDHRAIRFSPDRGYDVKQGDIVVVIRGDYRGKYGTVTRVCLDNKVLHVDPLIPGPAFQLPIIYFARDFSTRGDEDKQYIEKEVLIIGGEYRGWRGTLINLARDKCTVLRGISSRYTCSTDIVVVRGSRTRLSGRSLTPQEVLVVAGAFARAEVSSTSGRQRTPPPSAIDVPECEAETVETTTPSPWEVNESDREPCDTPALEVHEFMLHPNVLKSLETLHAVFQITGGQGSYISRLANTRIPNPFQSKDGQPVPKGQIAVLYTARTKGSRLEDHIMPETCLRVFPPVEKNSFCMVIEEKEDGERIGSVLSVTRVFKKDKKVAVQRVDGTQAAEDFLPMSRVIVVKPRL